MSARRLAVLIASVTSLASAAAACAASDDEPTVSAPDASLRDSSAVDAGTDAAEAASDAKDVPARTCSDQNFCHTALPADETLRGVWGDGTTVWAVSEQGDVLRWDGNAWAIHSSKLGALYAIWGSGPTDLWIGGERGVFHGTGATSQNIVFEPTAAPGNDEIPILSIWGTSADDVWAVGGNVDPDFAPRSRVLRWRKVGDAGASWALASVSSQPFAFSRVWGDATSGVWLAGDDGTEYSQTSAVFRRAPAANNFVRVTIGAFNEDEGPEQGIPGSISGAGWAADGRVMVLGRTKSATPSFWFAAAGAGGALTWSYEARDNNDQVLRSVWGMDGGATWLAGDYGRLRSREGAKWMQAALMIADLPVIEPLYGMWGTKSDDFWVVGRNTAIHRMRTP